MINGQFTKDFHSVEAHRAVMEAKLTPEQWITIRRRSEDQLRKNPMALRHTAALLAALELIKIADIVEVDPDAGCEEIGSYNLVDQL